MPPRLFLGMEIERFPDGSLLINQTEYARKIIERFRMEDAHAVSIPADQHQDLSLRHLGSEGETIKVPYKEAVGSLLYLAMVTRPDIAYAVNAVSQYAEQKSRRAKNTGTQ